MFATGGHFKCYANVFVTLVLFAYASYNTSRWLWKCVLEWQFNEKTLIKQIMLPCFSSNCDTSCDVLSPSARHLRPRDGAGAPSPSVVWGSGGLAPSLLQQKKLKARKCAHILAHQLTTTGYINVDKVINDLPILSFHESLFIFVHRATR